MKTLAVLLALLAATAAHGAELAFDPPVAIAEVGDTLTLDLEIGQVTDLLAASLVFTYDPAIVKPVSVTAGDVLVGAGCPWFLFWFAPAGDTLRVDMAALGCTWSAAGSLVTFRFVGLAGGESPFAWLRGDLRDSMNRAIPATWGAATLRVLGPVPATRSSWGAIKASRR